MDKLFIYLYQLIWTVILLLFSPFILLAKRSRIYRRLVPRLDMGLKPSRSIWVHALSVGEVLSSIPLIDALRKKYPDREIVFSATTLQGLRLARKELGSKVDVIMNMPLDFWWSIERIIEYADPVCFILVETDLWPWLLYSLEQKKINLILVNGRISPRTYRSYRRGSLFVRTMMNRFESCMMQSDLDRDRLISIGVKPVKVKTAGNIKFDREWSPMDEKERQSWLEKLFLTEEHTVCLAGSTHEGEDEILLDAFQSLIQDYKNMRLVIAPRKIDRAEDVRQLCLDRGLSTLMRTESGHRKNSYDVMILNTIGELGRLYGIADICFVGGSFAPIGGHNLLEPASFGKPVLFGPHMHNFVLMSEMLIEAGGGTGIKDGNEFIGVVEKLLSQPSLYEGMGKAALEFVESNRGALKRVLDEVEDKI